ncbi:MAG: hypothetical protein KKD48_04905 [Nanoarchaeota archaeon]|nr:hypothetical protein [Nanoarchaeota archaeon]
MYRRLILDNYETVIKKEHISVCKLNNECSTCRIDCNMKMATIKGWVN